MSENAWAIRGDKEIFACIETHKCAVCGGSIASKQWHSYIAIRERHFYMHNECFNKLLPEIETVIRSHTEPPRSGGEDGMTLKRILPTDGEWGVFVGNANGRGLIRIEVDGVGTLLASMPRNTQNIANAYLMAQAKKMYAELRALLPILGALEPTPGVVAHIEEIKGILIESEYRVREVGGGDPA